MRVSVASIDHVKSGRDPDAGRYGAAMSGGEVMIVLVVVGVASVVQATAGFGFALTAMPLLSTTVGAEHGLAIVSMVALFNSGTTWRTAHRDIHRRTVVVMVVSAIAGMPAGLWLLATADERTMRLLIAGSVAVAALLLGSGFRLRRAGPTVDAIAGLISGALSTSTGTSGPPLVFTLRARNLAASVRTTESCLGS